MNAGELEQPKKILFLVIGVQSVITFKVVEEQKRLLSNCLVEVEKCVNDRLYCEYRHFRYSCFNR